MHVVQATDNLYRIAVQYGTTVREIAALNGITNPNLIFIGQTLQIPATATQPDGATPTPTAEATTEATAEVTEEATAEVTAEATAEVTEEATVIPTAEPIATSEPTLEPTAEVTEPVATEAVTDATPTPAPTEIVATPEPTAEVTILPGSGVAFDYGVEVQLFGENIDKTVVINHLKTLGVRWVKQEVQWQFFEPTQGTIIWSDLDEVVSLVNGNEMFLMLTITNAPAWARDVDAENGPPVDNQAYANFVGAVAARYKGAVRAYEIWDEPNVRSQWNGKPLTGASYVELLGLAYAAIKTADPDAYVVSAGLRPTGLNDGVNAVDDRVYLTQMYQAGVAQVADAIGAHPLGYGNPPDSTCCENNPEILGWDDHPSFFFLDTVRDYRAIMNQFGDSGKFIWATEFGWGSSDGLGITPIEGLGFVGFTSLDEQADYTIRAFQKGRELGYVGPMFAWNLNLCSAVGISAIGTVECYWGMLNPVGDARPIFNVIANTPK